MGSNLIATACHDPGRHYVHEDSSLITTATKPQENFVIIVFFVAVVSASSWPIFF
jgi:hypothetical protein